MYVRPDIAAIEGYVPGEQPRGGKFIKLNTNENPYPCSPAVVRAIQATLGQGLQKYPDPMAEAFRRRTAELHGVEPSWIMCGNGSDDILTIVTRAFVGQGDLPAAAVSQLHPLQDAGSTAGGRIGRSPVSIRLVPRGRLWRRRERLKLVFLPNPNSPSGTMLPPERIRELADRLPCPLLVDEAYVDFADTNCVKLVTENEKILVSRSLSKSYALAGLRFGYIVAQPHLIEQLIKVKDSYNCDALSIAGATAAIDDQAWLAENRAKIITSRGRLTEGMRRLGFATVQSQANFVWNPHPSLGLRPLYERLKAERILVRFMDYAGWGDGLRISVGTDEQIDACLAALERMM